MAKPKKGVLALQSEVHTEEEWQELLSRPGLIVVDVYCGWSGPCAAMVSVLRKIKMEMAGDTISYAIARNDHINDLARFRGFSEPVWMFLEDGKMINLAFGANAPKLQKLLIAEVKRVQEGIAPDWKLPANQRGPEEEIRWKQEEAIRKVHEDKKKAEEEAQKKAEYEAFMTHMTYELCEAMAVILYPWVFRDEDGNPKIKMQCAPYTELTRDLLRGIFDVKEELRLQLDEETIKNMMVESDREITKELVNGLTDGKSMAIRLKSRPPPADWPVPYPHSCTDGEAKCPVRAINDVEKHFHSLLNLSHRKTIVGSLMATPRLSAIGTYQQRYEYIHDPDPENEGDMYRVDPALWAPYHARNKVHVFKTLFPDYLDENHPYVAPKPPPPLCAFKYRVQKLEDLRSAFEYHSEAVEYFGAYPFDEPYLVKQMATTIEEFQRKVKKPTTEIFVAIIRKISDEAFLAFAGINPYFASENQNEVERMIRDYFPEEKGHGESELATGEMYFDEEEEAAGPYFEADLYY